MTSLIPGANAALTAENPGLTELMIGFGWEIIPSRGPQSELVPLAILCDAQGKSLSNDHLVFFNQIVSQDGSVGFRDDLDTEEIDVDLARVPAEVAKIVFVVYVDPDVRGAGNFSSVRSAYVRVATRDNRELVRFVLPAGEYRTVDVLMFGELYRHRDDWKFRALGQGYSTGLRGVAADFRIDL
ncbi:tellurium resistance protein TerD [Cryobacterium sp. MP_3.1]|uniref:Chemical-damaging agent resistance protein C n=1 Tax=Cryobacterium zongtaii TaxID=1259217 RepID=A0A2S3ZBU7_9MICO|nr:MULTISPECIES: TerD family protein [Cryobacterium]MEC5185028.1 tellurium resistance protein TerD [Cryobacterium sp. MP_3.1]POH63338.1 chemical-damaging agent resistance protein C [Cryobacterium zongtaii]TFC53695.1 TerD family protein [Cryobacterium sp. TMB3-1-2]TFC58975.1 TerD family protein [Cryobacterium sp. TMB1-7]TFC75114.1 TerD family protein [Cryobacterium sp. TMB3-15]